MKDPRGVTRRRASLQGGCPQGGLHESAPGEFESVRRRRADRRRAGQITADDSRVSAGEVQATLPVRSQVHDPRAPGSPGPLALTRFVRPGRASLEAYKRRKPGNGGGCKSGARPRAGRRKRRMGIPSGDSKRAPQPRHDIRRERPTTGRTGEQVPELVIRQKMRNNGARSKVVDRFAPDQTDKKDSQRYEPPLAGVGPPHPRTRSATPPPPPPPPATPPVCELTIPPHAAAFFDHGSFS